MSSTPSIEQSAMISGRGRVVVVFASVILEDVAHLKVVVAPLVANKVALIRSPHNLSIVGGITTSLRSAERN